MKNLRKIISECIYKALLNEWHHSYDNGLMSDAENITNKLIKIYKENGKEKMEDAFYYGLDTMFTYYLSSFDSDITVSIYDQKNTAITGHKLLVGIPYLEDAVKTNDTQRLVSLIYHEFGHFTNIEKADSNSEARMDIKTPLFLSLDEKTYDYVRHCLYRFQEREIKARCFETTMFLRKNKDPNITIQDIYNDRCSDIALMRNFVERLNSDDEQAKYIIKGLYGEIFKKIITENTPFEIQKRKVLFVLNNKLDKFTKKINKIFADYKLQNK